MCENAKGEVTILYKNQLLSYSIFHKPTRQAEVVDTKTLDRQINTPNCSARMSPTGCTIDMDRLTSSGRKGPEDIRGLRKQSDIEQSSKFGYIMSKLVLIIKASPITYSISLGGVLLEVHC